MRPAERRRGVVCGDDRGARRTCCRIVLGFLPSTWCRDTAGVVAGSWPRPLPPLGSVRWVGCEMFPLQVPWLLAAPLAVLATLAVRFEVNRRSLAEAGPVRAVDNGDALAIN